MKCFFVLQEERVIIPAADPPPDGDEPRERFMSYMALICAALEAANNRSLRVCEIYSHIREEHPDQIATRPHWQSAIRHCLSVNPMFKKAWL